MPVDLDGWTLSEQVQAGENVAALLEHPGFADLCKVVKLHGEGILLQATYRKPDPDSASYADMVGHLRGLREVELIARGIVENGRQAAVEQRRMEMEGN